MTTEIQKYVVMGWWTSTQGKKKRRYHVDKVISIGKREGDHEPILQRHAQEFKEKWPIIEEVTWEPL